MSDAHEPNPFKGRLDEALAALRRVKELSDLYDGAAESMECSLWADDREAAHDCRTIAREIRNAIGAGLS